ncbi:MAG TPA: hypothetical protein VFD39_13490, partial [Trueperaceae bacterium]|nr:hypothetical protein [Trueperaceae bacterium]
MTTTSGTGVIIVTWTDNSTNEDGFRIYRTTMAALGEEATPSEVIGVAAANKTSFTDDRVSAGSSYEYEVTAFNGASESARSKQDNPPMAPRPRDLIVSVTKAGSGSGVVTSSPAGIDCGSVCSKEFVEGSSVTLTATPTTGSTFGGWSGACTGKSSTCVVDLASNGEVVATFTKIAAPPPGERTLSVLHSGTGSGLVVGDPAGISCPAICSANYADGAVVNLTAIPESGSVFAGWSGACTGQDTSCDVTMSSNRTVTAEFKRNYELTVQKAGEGAGQVTSAPSGILCGSTCDSEFLEGTEIVLSAMPDAASEFSGWSGGGCSGTGTCTLTLNADTNVIATFSPELVDLTASVVGLGKITSSPAGIDCGNDCSQSMTAGTSVTLTAVPQPSWEFVSWGGACSGSALTCQLVVDEDLSVKANFGDTAIVVDTNSGSSGGASCSLRDAITAANTDTAVAGCRAGSGPDAIRLPEATTIPLLSIDNEAHGPNGLPSISSEILILGNSAVIERGMTETLFRIFHVGPSGKLTLENLTVRHGHGGVHGGGGIYVDRGELTLLEVTMERNLVRGEDALGAALLSDTGSVVVRGSFFQDNADPGEYPGVDPFDLHGGVVASVDGYLGVFGSALSGNGTTWPSDTNSVVRVQGESSSTEIKDSTITDNGDIAIWNEGALSATNVMMRSNANEWSGGVHNFQSGVAYLE